MSHVPNTSHSLNNPTINRPVTNTPSSVSDFVPIDIFRLIASFFDNPKDVIHLGSINLHLLTHLLPSDILWDSLLDRHFPDSYAKLKLHNNSLDSLALYKGLTNIVHNMKAGKYRLQTLSGHQGAIECVKIVDDKIISGSRDNTLKIWDLQTGKELQTLTGHTDAIFTVTVCDGKIISGSENGTLKIWDLQTGKELQTLTGHNRSIYTVTVCDGKIISGSGDHTLKIWDFNNPSLSPYSQQILEENLDILGKMTHAEFIQQPEVVKELAKKLHPDFQERLKQHAYKVQAPFCCSAAVILRVQTEVCVEALLDAIHREDDDKVSQLLHQLVWIHSKNTQIYEILWNICDKPELDRWGEYAFHQGWAPPSKKEQAVMAFKQVLKDRWGEDVPLLLADLGIVTKEEYSQQLGCTSDFLPKIGLASPADLQALLNSSDIQQIQITLEDTTEDLKQLQDSAFAKKERILTHLDALSTAAQQKSEEAKQCSVLRDENGNVYETANPWMAFQEKLSEFKAVLDMQCQTPKALLIQFSPESYAGIVKEVNALIDEFRALEREHHISRLRAYSSQWGILGKWNRLRSQGVPNLSALLQQRDAPQDIFNMGE